LSNARNARKKCPKRAQECPKRAQECPKRAQECPKGAFKKGHIIHILFTSKVFFISFKIIEGYKNINLFI